MEKKNINFKKYILILPIYILYILIFELILGCSIGDIWDKLTGKFNKNKKIEKN